MSNRLGSLKVWSEKWVQYIGYVAQILVWHLWYATTVNCVVMTRPKDTMWVALFHGLDSTWTSGSNKLKLAQSVSWLVLEGLNLTHAYM